MSEFQPENTASSPSQGPAGAEAYNGMPDLQGQPFDPRRAYAQQPPAPATAYPNQQAAPPAQAYGQAVPMAVGPQNPQWGAPPPAWNAAPTKKRKVWPWVVGGVGGAAVLGVAAIVVVLFVGKAAVDGVNPNYDAPPVTQQDVATGGGTLVIADGANASFEIDPAWTDQTELVLGGDSLGDDVALSYIGAWSTADFAAGQDVSLITVIVGTEGLPLIDATLRAEHESSVDGFFSGLGGEATDVQVTDTVPATTASGLEGLHSSFTAGFQGLTLAGDLYTFARGQNVFMVQVTSYNGIKDETSAKQILDTARIDS
ncbi:MAG: hypothetical protein HGA51_00125 [Demequinaceae bacterium]|nr:hypothetical protein [Demequinaceae bacterium]